MRPVNLMNKQQAQKRSLPPVAVMVAALAPVAAIAIVFAAYSYEHGKVQKGQNRLAAVQAEIAAIPPPHAQSTSILASIATDRNARQSSLDAALADRFDLDGALIAIARVLPSDVWLTSLSLDSPTPADTPPPTPTTTTGSTTTSTTTTTATTTAPTVNVNAFTISGYTYSQASVANLLTQLSLLPQLSDVTLSSSASNASPGSSGSGSASGSATGASGSKAAATKPLVQFAVSAAVNPTPGEEGT
jgi:Tfp pilus assembly protein PilN